MIKQKIPFYILIVVLISSCEKNNNIFIPLFDVKKLDEFLDPPRTHILINSGGELYFMEENPSELLQLVLQKGEKNESILSPEADFAAYKNEFNQVFKIGTQEKDKPSAVGRLNGANHIHFTNDGFLFAVFSETTTIRFEGAGLIKDIPVFPIDTEKNEKLIDAVFLDNGDIVLIKQSPINDENGNVLSHQTDILTWDKDSAYFYSNRGEEFYPNLKSLQLDIDENIIAYDSYEVKKDSVNAYLIKTKNDSVFSEVINLNIKSRVRKSSKDFINSAYQISANAIYFENALKQNGYPNIALDDTLHFDQFLKIDEFDIKIPVENTPPQEPPF